MALAGDFQHLERGFGRLYLAHDLMLAAFAVDLEEIELLPVAVFADLDRARVALAAVATAAAGTCVQ
jgi:hypothetical protein